MKEKAKIIKHLKGDIKSFKEEAAEDRELIKSLGKKGPRRAAREVEENDEDDEIVNSRLRYDMDKENGECDDSIQSIRDEDRRKSSAYHVMHVVPNNKTNHAYYEMKFLKQGESENSEY